jgi:hypothetical protein
MTRRPIVLLILLALALLVAPRAADTQHIGRVPRIGVVVPGEAPSPQEPILAAFSQGLQHLGYLEGQTIRLKSPAGTEHCPITAVYECCTGQTYPPAAVYSTLERLGLDPDDAYTIVMAADGQTDEPIIRHQLLAALALSD